MKDRKSCGMMLDMYGPFYKCIAVLNEIDDNIIKEAYGNCVYDICANWDDPGDLLCDALANLMGVCYENNVGPIKFRSDSFCPCKLTLLLPSTTCLVLANSVDPDQLASEEAN